MLEPEILILSSKFDYSTDLVTTRLEKMDVPYVRLNRDQFSTYDLELDPIKSELTGVGPEYSFRVSESKLKSILYRAPTFLRDTVQPGITPEDQAQRSQWSGFLRSIMVFDKPRWINHPKQTYLAEIKPVQLKFAYESGFNVPDTTIGNSFPTDRFKSKVAYKSIEPSIVQTGENRESFLYTNILPTSYFNGKNLRPIPGIFQKAIGNKTDFRVTIIGTNINAVEITQNHQGIEGDWRRARDKLFQPTKLPERILEACIKLMKRFNLIFGAIDLVKSGEDFYFIEINPTGEWGWLNDHFIPNLDDLLISELVK